MDLRDTASRTGAIGVFLLTGRLFFRSRFRPHRGRSWRSESFKSCLNVSSFLKFWTCRSNCSEQGRICVQRRPYHEENCEIFNMVSFLPSVFARMVDVAPDVGFWRSCVARNLALPSLLKFRTCAKASLGSRDTVLRTEAVRVFFHA